MYIACLLLDFTPLAVLYVFSIGNRLDYWCSDIYRNDQITWREICASPPHTLLVRALNSKQMFHRLNKDTIYNSVVLTTKHKYDTISSLNSNVQNETLGFIGHA